MIGLLFRAFRRIVIDISVLTIFFLLAPGLPPYDATFSSYSVTPALPLTGALNPNGELDSGERLFEGKFTGPESIAWKTHDEIFLSIHGGTIIKLYGKRFDRIARVTRIGPECAGPWQEKICGRPLGLRFAPDGNLLVADAYYGIYSVNVDTGDKECLVSPDQEIDGKPFKVANDLDVDSDGNIYWSDSSSNADLTDGLIIMAADPTGRLMKYDPATGRNEVLLKDIHFANGVQLSSNQDFVVLAETGRYRIHRYWLKGDMAGRSDIFLDGLPGFPDNIRPRPDGGFYVSLIKPRLADEKNPMLYIMENVPVCRKLAVRVLCVAQWIIDSINKVYPHEILEKASYYVLNLSPLDAVYKSNISIVVEVDEEGNILGSLQGSTGNIAQISETAHIGDNIFFGSPYNKYLGRLYVGPAPTSVDEETPIEDEPLFEAIGKGITMKKPKYDTVTETDETKKVKEEEQVKKVELDQNEKVGEGQELEKNTKHEEYLVSESVIKDQRVEVQEESEQDNSVEEQKTVIEQQDIETIEAEVTKGEKPVDLIEEEFIQAVEDKTEGEILVNNKVEDVTHEVDEVIANITEEDVDKDDAVEEELPIEVDSEEVGAVDSEVIEEGKVDLESTADETEDDVDKDYAVKEELPIEVDLEEVGAVDSEVIEEGKVDLESTADESQFAQNPEDIETDDVGIEGEEYIKEADTQNIADDVAHLEDDIPDKGAATENVKPVDDVIPDKEPQQIEEPVVDEQSQQMSEQKEESKEVNQAPQVQENKDEL